MDNNEFSDEEHDSQQTVIPLSKESLVNDVLVDTRKNNRKLPPAVPEDTRIIIFIEVSIVISSNNTIAIATYVLVISILLESEDTS